MASLGQLLREMERGHSYLFYCSEGRDRRDAVVKRRRLVLKRAHFCSSLETGLTFSASYWSRTDSELVTDDSVDYCPCLGALICAC